MSKVYYTKDHEWLQVQDGQATVGITSYAQEQLGEVVFVDLPELNKTVTQNDPVAVIESVKAASDVYTPICGTIQAVNELLLDEPGLVNQAPQQEGWLWKMSIKDEKQLEGLMSENDYTTFLS